MQDQNRASPSHQKEEDEEQYDSSSPVPLIEMNHLKGTITADTTTNIMFIRTHFKSTLWLVLIVLVLKMLPQPLIITKFENDPSLFTRQACNDDSCDEVNEGYESIIIKKINPLHRELKYFVKLNYPKTMQYTQVFHKNVNLNKQITWIQIYAARNNEIYGSIVYQKAGEDAYQIIFNNEPLIYIGEVHILTQVSYLIKIYKNIHKYQQNTALRFLQAQPTLNQPQSNQTNTNQTHASLTNSTNSTNGSNSTSNSSSTNNSSSNSTSTNNSSSNSTSTNSSSNRTRNEQQKKQGGQKQISVPLIIQLVRYSQFYTGTQLLIRYVTFLFVMYVRAETSQCPKIFQAILFITSNPLIFTEIAFPNTASNVFSSMCSSMYIFYIPIFLFYTHRKVKNQKLNIGLVIIKMLASIGLYIVSVIRSLHLMNQTFVQTIQYILIVAILIPIVKYLWRMYFVRSKVVLHRNMLFVVLTIYYFALLFFSGYIVDYGWKKISFYLIIQTYGISLCYLTTPQLSLLNHPKPSSHMTTALSPNSQQHQPMSVESHATNTIQVDRMSVGKDREGKDSELQAHFVNIL